MKNRKSKPTSKWVWLCFLAALLLCLGASGVFAQSARTVVLSDKHFVASIVPGSLEVSLQQSGGAQVPLSSAQSGLGRVTKLKANSTRAEWELPDLKLRVTATLEKGGLSVHLLSDKPGKITFPIIAENKLTRGWILPMFEGVYAPCGDERWATFLTGCEDMNTTADLTLPFLGMDCGEFTLTCIITNAFNNTLQFVQRPDKILQARLTHEFTSNHTVRECAFLFVLGANSPVEPAKTYRNWLMKRGEFVTLAEKIKKTPEAAKLPGAAHIYLWGSELVAPDDVLNWKQFAKELEAQGKGEAPTPAKRVWMLMTPEARKFVVELSKAQWPDKYSEKQITTDLSRILRDRVFYDKTFWPRGTLEQGKQLLLKKDRGDWTKAETCRVNSALLTNGFPGMVARLEDWGDGICPKMVRELRDTGFDRLWLGSGSWDEFEERPETVEAARRAGFLIGPYDSYDSIHSPKEKDTWETAQFDEALYETGGIVNADGSRRRGFRKKGYRLSPVAARPYVEERVTKLMHEFRANSWFMDCDGFGEFFDDYSNLHPATQQSDMQARLERMEWIRDSFGAVVGTEGCFAGVASTVFFAHGVMTPVIGWGDPDLTNRNSKYYLGRYYPPEQPEVFFKTVPTKEQYRYIYFEPRFRLPLFETVFHDSVVATHHWSFPSLKTSDEAGTVELLELLYNVPPLYHLNLAEFQKRKAQIKRHYDFFSPLHRETATMPMTDFQWLTKDRSVQRTVFGNHIEMIANFGTTEYTAAGLKIPGRSVLARWQDTGWTEIYSVAE